MISIIGFTCTHNNINNNRLSIYTRCSCINVAHAHWPPCDC